MNSFLVEDMPRATAVARTDDELSVPLVWFACLAKATPAERARSERLGDGQGIYWPEIDEDISVAGLVAGRHTLDDGQRAWFPWSRAP